MGEAIDDGHCMKLEDDMIIGGNSIDNTLSKYVSALCKLYQNNLKLSPTKVFVFTNNTEVYCYWVKNGIILPSDHTVKSLGKVNIKDLITGR